MSLAAGRVRAVPRGEVTLGTARTGTSGLTRPGQWRPPPEQGFRLEVQTATRPAACGRSDRNKAHSVAIVVEENEHISVRIEYDDVPRVTDVLHIAPTLTLHVQLLLLPTSPVAPLPAIQTKASILSPPHPLT